MKIYSADTLAALSRQAIASQRLRCNLNIHEQLSDEVQRLFLAFEPDTYIRPHRHPQAHKWELLVLLQGALELLIFNDNGEITQRTPLSSTTNLAVEIPANSWHSYISLSSGSLALEIKQGAYIAPDPQDFAAWAPAENTPAAADYLAQLRQA